MILFTISTVPIDNEIDQFLVRNVREHPADIVRLSADHFGYTRQGIYQHVKRLVDSGVLHAEGQTRARRYSLVTNEISRDVELRELREDVVWREQVAPSIEGLPDNVLRIAQYGYTEILNNAIVHSQGSKVKLGIRTTAADVQFVIWDDGIGIFRKIKEELFLEDERHSILELSKGKLTTNPARHSGEGIFFTTRSFDDFTILAGNLSFVHAGTVGDWLVDERSFTAGTFVVMTLDLFTTRTLREVFDRYTSRDDDFGFSRTQIPVSLAKYGDENLVSRSQAKRVVARLDRFKEVVLDFSGVATIGQAFADEIFRVFQSDHPDVHIVWTDANEEVTSMIRRVTG